jgi:ATP-dependent Zn protease
LLQDNFNTLQAIADALLEKETLDREQLEEVAKENGVKLKEAN